jgi:DNA-binding XRE family transcriptional regulator
LEAPFLIMPRFISAKLMVNDRRRFVNRLARLSHKFIRGIAEGYRFDYTRSRQEVCMEVPRLRELRQRAFLTQMELAEKSGVSHITINRLENGASGRASSIRKLAVALGVPPSALVALPNEEGNAAA